MIRRLWAKIVSSASLAGTLLFGAPCAPAQTTQSASTCAPSGYAVGYANGIWTSRNDAERHVRLLRDTLGTTYNGQPLTVQLLYNSSAGKYSLQDLAETFEQRVNQIDPSHTLDAHWELFWEQLYGENTTANTISQFDPTLDQLFTLLQSAIKGTMITDLSYMVTSPPTESDNANNNTIADGWFANNKQILLIGHSQGNLFADEVYDHLTRQGYTANVKIVEIAPPDTVYRGGYALSDSDIVINGLRLAFGHVSENNIVGVPVSTLDLLGHSFENIYLNFMLIAGDGKSVGNHVQSTILTALAGLSAPRCVVVLTATPGDGKVTLTWPTLPSGDPANLYWSKSSSLSITDSDATQVANATSGVTVNGLQNGTPYYFLLSDVTTRGEYPTSTVASATPAASSTLTYNYVGGDFTDIQIPGAPYTGPEIAGHVTASVTFTGIPRNFTGIVTSGHIASLTISVNNSSAVPLTYPGTASGFPICINPNVGNLFTLQNGVITDWNVDVYEGTDSCALVAFEEIGTYSTAGTPPIYDSAYLSLTAQPERGRSGVKGTWTAAN